jgi:pyruvate/2-oxoglutarate dehydrogenase complex dihydrolipoamide acyltransferase (E2) component
MSKPKPTFEVKPFPLARRVIIDSGRIGKRKHWMIALIEADVTQARQIIHAYKAKTGEDLSFTAFIMACLGAAIDQNKYLHACRDVWGRLILFDEVDCTTIIEIDLEGQKFPLAHVARAINKRSPRSIHEEIRSIQATPQASASLKKNPKLFAIFLLLPAFIRDLFYRILARSPQLMKQQVGTVMVSSVGMFGKGSGWGIAGGSFYTTDVLLGGIAEKLVMADGQPTRREVLSITINMDHDILDGAPAARFVSRFKERIEEAYGLEEYKVVEASAGMDSPWTGSASE